MEWEAAAAAIDRANWFLLATGAGFSADSGLPTFIDIADVDEYRCRDLTYGDLCRPELLFEDPALALGFWGRCLHEYRRTAPHIGYTIVERWVQQRWRPGRTYAYTSNIDGHLRGRGMPVCEIHGCLEEWMCSSRMGLVDVDGTLKPRDGKVWTAFNASMLEVRGKPVSDGCTAARVTPPKGFAMPLDGVHACLHEVSRPGSPAMTRGPITFDGVPRCECGVLARPAVMMFNDPDPGLAHCFEAQREYQLWEDSMEKSLAEDGSEERLVILEIGCGVRVPSVRQEAEAVRRDVGASATHIRVNPDCADGADIALRCGAREALDRLDTLLT
eukprot:TRINITY_DN29281_c0_g1_i1.p1 TRINITY_DN29281_c0_g1~~TRINITY_DN29281_c0_g1_i1.p1  ORF type:complete len:359 (+),score=28.05 TRINITY_DN29281_c0_g1_i1:90-1079(+)